MAAENPRVCGFRKIGGTYLIGGEGARRCGLLPSPLLPCVDCGSSIRFTRGLQRVPIFLAFRRDHRCEDSQSTVEHLRADPRCFGPCPMPRSILQHDQAAMTWIGRQYSPAAFVQEATEQGVSRRIGELPEWIEVGDWILCAHLDGWGQPCDGDPHPEDPCSECDNTGTRKSPGIIYAFRLTSIERIVPDNATDAELSKLTDPALGGDPRLTLVKLPHDDPDHAPDSPIHHGTFTRT